MSVTEAPDASAVERSVSDDRWQRAFTYLPFPLLALAALVGLTVGPTAFGAPSRERLVVELVLVVVTVAWMWWWTIAHPGWRDDPTRMRIHYVGRTVLALGLVTVNPFYCIFAWIGFLDLGWFRGRAAYVAVGVTAIAMAGGQSGALPPESAPQAGLFAALWLLNLGLASMAMRFHHAVERTSIDRAEAIRDLERLNADLEQTLAENVALQETVAAQARVAGVQEERQRLAREIHDTIAQSLAGILAQLQAAQQEGDPGGRIGRATELTREALAEARRSVRALAPAPLTGGVLTEAMEELVGRWDADHPARATVVITGEVRPLHPEVEATVLRIAQEALVNVAKHARAGRVGVTLTYDGAEVILDVRDDGCGFDQRRPAASTSFGLRGMRQRTERLAGVLELETEPGGGTALSLRLPALDRSAA